MNIKNADFQFRILRKNIKFVNKVHEVPEPIKRKEREKVVVINEVGIAHPKTVSRQNAQNLKYEKMLTESKKINKLIYDSVLFTKEGITKHAREEIRELTKRGWSIMCINDLPHNIDEENSFILKTQRYFPIDTANYFTIINQPPIRWERSLFLKNPIGFLAFEGILIPEWVNIINSSPILELWTPSNGCKKKFIDSGVTKPIYVIPHGVDVNVWHPKPNTAKSEAFTYLWAGTPHCKRKGLDLAVDSFLEVFENKKDVRLVLKVNKIYNKGQDVDSLIRRYAKGRNIDNIYIIDQDLSENEFVDLMNSSHVFLATSREEGFGIIPLQAMACGVPVVATACDGHSDYLNKNNSFVIEMGEEKDADWIYPYFITKWREPKKESIKENMREVYTEYSKASAVAKLNIEKIKNNHTWKSTVDKIEFRLNTLKSKLT